MKEKNVLPRIYNINKPKGMTSHDVVSRMRRILKTKKVGHTGTLDPDATGVLPICVGRATKVSNLILEKDKEYICEMILGIETDTYDVSGEIIQRNDTESISMDSVYSAISSQVGEINQYPPVYSALKVNGKKMCDLARAGRADEIDIKPRRVNIREIEIIDYSNIEYMSTKCILVKMRILCSKGTYIRSICHDVGEILRVGGSMYSLIRTQSGIFRIEDSISLEQLESMSDSDSLESVSFEIEDVLLEFAKISLKKNAVKYYSNGGKIESSRFVFEDGFDSRLLQDLDNLYRVYTDGDVFIGVGKIVKENGKIMIKSEKMFNLDL